MLSILLICLLIYLKAHMLGVDKKYLNTEYLLKIIVHFVSLLSIMTFEGC